MDVPFLPFSSNCQQKLHASLPQNSQQDAPALLKFPKRKDLSPKRLSGLLMISGGAVGLRPGPRPKKNFVPNQAVSCFSAAFVCNSLKRKCFVFICCFVSTTSQNASRALLYLASATLFAFSSNEREPWQVHLITSSLHIHECQLPHRRLV